MRRITHVFRTNFTVSSPVLFSSCFSVDEQSTHTSSGTSFFELVRRTRSSIFSLGAPSKPSTAILKELGFV